jgi:hypothetical protein
MKGPATGVAVLLSVLDIVSLSFSFKFMGQSQPTLDTLRQRLCHPGQSSTIALMHVKDMTDSNRQGSGRPWRHAPQARKTRRSNPGSSRLYAMKQGAEEDHFTLERV